MITQAKDYLGKEVKVIKEASYQIKKSENKPNFKRNGLNI